MALTRLVNDYKDSVRLASTGANINLAAAPNTLDGVSLSLNDRVLVKDQSPSYLNGIYRVTTLGTGSNGSWTRSSDFNDWREISPGAMVFVEAGSINGNAFYFINGAGSNVTIDTTAINFSNLYSVNGNVTSFPGNVNVAGTLTVTGNIVTKSYETVTLTEYANVQNVAGNINVTNGGNINIGDGGNIYMGSTALPRFRTGNTAPVSPNLGDTWYQGNTDILYEYIQDANNNKYWLDLSSNPSSYGNLTVANTLTINGNLSASVSSINITGGTNGYVLSTNGSGALSWVAVSATAGGSNSFVQFNDGGSLGGSTYLQYNKTSGNLVSNSTTTSTNTTTGAIVAPSLGISGNVNANAFYSNYYLYSNGSTITTPAGGGNTMVQFNDGSNFSGATYLQYNKTSGNLVSNSTTTSTSTTTGALVIGGGSGIGGNLYVGGYATFGSGQGGVLFRPLVGGTALALYNTNIVPSQTNYSWLIDGAAVTINGTSSIYTAINNSIITSANSATFSIGTTTTSTSTVTGALQVSGGAGISGNINAAGYIVANGAFNESTTTPGIYIGNLNATARIGFFNGNASANWQIDNSLGTFRWYTPGTTRMSIDYGGNLTLPGAMLITNTSISNSPTTGALTITGGVGVGGSVYGNIFNGAAVYAGTIGNTSATHYGATYAATSGFLPNANNAVSLANATNYMSSIYGVNYFVANALAPIANATVNYGTTSAMPLNDYAVNYNVANSIIPIANTTASIGSAQRTFQNIYGVSFFGTSTTAKYADLAEMYHADDYYSPGTVMIFGGDLDVTIAKVSHDTRIAGVVSTNPAYLMNDNFEQDNWVPVALTGRVPCNVCGPVQKGDLLVSSDKPGIAIKLDKSKYEVGCIIGKSLDVINDTSVRKIEIAVGRY